MVVSSQPTSSAEPVPVKAVTVDNQKEDQPHLATLEKENQKLKDEIKYLVGLLTT